MGTKYFPEESLTYWDNQNIFYGMWEQVETGKYLPIVIIDGENMGTDGMRSEIENMNDLKSFPLSDYPRARYIGCSEAENGTYLFWKGEDGTCYMEILGVMEVERWFQKNQKRNKKADVRDASQSE